MIVFSAGTWLFLTKTRLGAIVRAGTDDSPMVEALGINISKVYTYVFGFGAALAGLAGILAGPIQEVTPLMGNEILVLTFVGGGNRGARFHCGFHYLRTAHRGDHHPGSAVLAGRGHDAHICLHGGHLVVPAQRSVWQRPAFMNKRRDDEVTIRYDQ